MRSNADSSSTVGTWGWLVIDARQPVQELVDLVRQRREIGAAIVRHIQRGVNAPARPP